MLNTLQNNTTKLYSLNQSKLIKGMTPLYTDVLQKNIVNIIDLLNNGADITQKNAGEEYCGSFHSTDLYYKHHNKNSIELAIEIGDMDIVNLLLDNNKGNNGHFLSIACKKQNLKIIKLLVSYKVDVNYIDEYGEVPLYYAIEAKKANKEIIRFLIANGADINKENNNGISPLSFAESSKISLIKVLTENLKIELSDIENIDARSNHQNLSEKIVLQNKVINKLKNEVKAIKKQVSENSIEKNYQLLVDDYKETLLTQSIEIKELQNKLIENEEERKSLINNFMSKINKLEQKFAKQKVVKAQKLLNIPTEKQSIKKDDGVIVKRESFDDF